MSFLLMVIFFLSRSNAADLVISKSHFVESMKTSVPNVFCEEKQYFRKCFKISEDECIKEALRATKVCVASMEDVMPSQFHQPVDGRKWGEKLGTCVGTAYEISLLKNKVDSADCKNISKWK